MILNKPLEENETPIQQNRKTFAQDRKRVLAIYGGIFPDNITEFANRIAKKHKRKQNYSK